MKRNRRAKIVATVGPSSSSPAMLKKLFLAGVDVFRQNFSHGSHDDHAKVHAAIRALEKETGRPIGIMQDLQGPKIRLGKIKGGKDGKLMLKKGDTVRLVLKGGDGSKKGLPLPHKEVFAAMAPGHKFMIDDGKVRLTTTKVDSDSFEAEVTAGGNISDRKGVNLPDTVMALSPLTPKDRKDLEFGFTLGFDWVALSFVQKPADIIEARKLIGDRSNIMVKIEKPSAIEHIDEIVMLSDTIMIARGDLGVEIPPEDVPGRQKELIHACRLKARPVIVATQMLESMIESPTPTRAEASDVATAVFDGASAVMLSAESAAGKYPLEAVKMMNRIVARTEEHKTYRSIITALQPQIEATPPHAVSSAAAYVANIIHAKAIVAFTSSGTTAARISRGRAETPILALTPDINVARMMTLYWGVHSAITDDEMESYRGAMAKATDHAAEQGFAKRNDMIVVVAGFPFGVEGTTNNLRVVTV